MSTNIEMKREELFAALASMTPQTLSYTTPDGQYKTVTIGGPALVAYIMRLEGAVVKLATKLAERD